MPVKSGTPSLALKIVPFWLPTESFITVPDVSSLDVGTATSTLSDSGFKPKVAYQDVTDPSLDGTVLSQNPGGGTEAKPGTTVTITVGRITQQQTTTTTDTTTTTP